MRRLHARAEKGYTLKRYRAFELLSEPKVLIAASDLHNKNILKYGLPVNFYNEKILTLLAQSHLQEHFRVWMHFKNSGGAPAQVMILLEDPADKAIYYLIQGIDETQVDKGDNLYVAAVFEVGLYAQEKGYKTVWLGRGNAEKKQKLGANKFYLLNHWILPPHSSQTAKEELEKIAKASEKLLAPTLQSLPVA